MATSQIAKARTTPGIGEAPPSPAGPLGADEPALPLPPTVPVRTWRQLLQINFRQIEFVFRWRRLLGETFQINGVIDDKLTFTSHPDHVKSLFTADPAIVPSLAAESPLAPIVGRNSVLTANGPRHLRQRKLLLPAFHGDAIDRYTTMIEEVIEREIDRWPVGRPISLAPRMQDVTLEVIMGGILGVDGRPAKGTPEYGLRQAVKTLTWLSTKQIAQVAELMNIASDEPVGFTKRAIAMLDRYVYRVLADRRAAADVDERTDILSTIMRARTEDGEPLTDRELRDELVTLIFAGFETTANSLGWAWERLTHTPTAYDTLLHAVREDEDADEWIEATILETMRSRPVVPIIGRRAMQPWRLGDYSLPADSPILVSILLVHHREDLYPEPFAFRPDRWIGQKPGTYEWIPFGGGTRRCLGASLAMAEQRVVLRAMARRLDIDPAAPEAEHVNHRNVTMIPRQGARVVIRKRG